MARPLPRLARRFSHICGLCFVHTTLLPSSRGERLHVHEGRWWTGRRRSCRASWRKGQLCAAPRHASPLCSKLASPHPGLPAALCYPHSTEEETVARELQGPAQTSQEASQYWDPDPADSRAFLSLLRTLPRAGGRERSGLKGPPFPRAWAGGCPSPRRPRNRGGEAPGWRKAGPSASASCPPALRVPVPSSWAPPRWGPLPSLALRSLWPGKNASLYLPGAPSL